MIKHADIKIFGRVQGVFFRYSAQDKAKKLGLSGFARNEPDNSVYIEAEGEEEQLEKFLEWCKKGPLVARVEKIDRQFTDALKNFSDFVVE